VPPNKASAFRANYWLALLLSVSDTHPFFGPEPLAVEESMFGTRKTAVVIADEEIFYRCILKEKYCKDCFLSASYNNSRLSLRLSPTTVAILGTQKNNCLM
jgi:hypothetical protein